jgi:hypothetical protein
MRAINTSPVYGAGSLCTESLCKMKSAVIHYLSFFDAAVVAWIANEKLVFRKSSARGVDYILQAASPCHHQPHIKLISNPPTSPPMTINLHYPQDVQAYNDGGCKRSIRGNAGSPSPTPVNFLIRRTIAKVSLYHNCTDASYHSQWLWRSRQR